MATDKESLTVRLRDACVGHPSAEIPWPHRILHEAADRIAELEARCAKYEAFTTAYVNWATSDADGRAEGEYFVEMVEAYDALEKALEVKP